MRFSSVVVVGLLCACSSMHAAESHETKEAAKEATKDEPQMQLGNFSVSLTVKDLAASRAFYEKLGFRAGHGDEAQGWLVLQNGTTKIGLFKGMFERNMLTFNPGWDSSANPLADFTDVRELQKELVKSGLAPEPKADESTDGPAYLMLTDPDGNPILIDQHVPRPKR